MSNGTEVFSNQVVPQHEAPLLVEDGESVVSAEMDSDSKRPFVDGRIKKKAKRPSKLIASGDVSPVLPTAPRTHPQYRKNSRRPRNGHGRGQPKKGGAGGKGTWGKPGSELSLEEDDDISAADARDPNYDSDNQENCEFESIVPELTEDEFENTVYPLLLEYFEHGDTNEVVLSLEEHNLSQIRPHLVCLAVSLAMERKPSHREMTSVLLSDMYGRILAESDFETGFQLLFKSLPDLVLDTPDATTVLGNFLARAVADDCLPPKYVQLNFEETDCTLARQTLQHASTLLSMKHGLVRLDNVWGMGGGMRPVKYLVKKIQMLLKEYLCSGDVNEAIRCLQDLEVPHFHHELVYEAVVMVIEDMGDMAMELMCKLLRTLDASVIVTPEQMKRGFDRVFQEMPDICIDVPAAYTVLEKFVTKCTGSGFLSREIAKTMPARGRKRFVSEGDGGRLKEDAY
ncbi:programmed cell death protein 4 [Ixodes scapularis]|uniref:Programmed cell death protein 4 n=1 Tax=Ixodes scapularis TaxID=6945 RepID=B7PJK8_IXOSC|nr:programmed cell death protein 4 [Ixodes scapularis]EEC06780.1 programmed cell death-involved protein, putative [Ixodes scapularis]|eukprot:XP_002408251.1 programmed cell death-involved protein, putative [Ixodes scapularis]